MDVDPRAPVPTAPHLGGPRFHVPGMVPHDGGWIPPLNCSVLHPGWMARRARTATYSPRRPCQRAYGVSVYPLPVAKLEERYLPYVLTYLSTLSNR